MLSAEISDTIGARELELAFELGSEGCLALAGPSGAGKTSVLRIVAGLRRPRHGRVRCGGELWLDTRRGIERPPERRGCGYLFQEHALFGHLRVWQNVAYGLGELPRSQRRGRARELLERFGVAELAERRPGALSGGERQRVALARALAPRPRALLLDEPLASLDARTRAHAAGELVGALRDAHVPALLVTHDFLEAAVIAERVAVIDEGRIVQSGTPAELAARPLSAFVADFTGAVVLTGTARDTGDGLTRVELDGGGAVFSSDRGSGAVAATVHPSEITVEHPGRPVASSARNRLETEVVSVTPIGGRVRLGLAAGQPLTAEVTAAAVRQLELAPRSRVIATWKASATRLVRR